MSERTEKLLQNMADMMLIQSLTSINILNCLNYRYLDGDLNEDVSEFMEISLEDLEKIKKNMRLTLKEVVNTTSEVVDNTSENTYIYADTVNVKDASSVLINQ